MVVGFEVDELPDPHKYNQYSENSYRMVLKRLYRMQV
jgi:hypothetical protein